MTGPRWTARQKLGVIDDLRSGRVSREATLRRYEMPEEELAAWERSYDARGLLGLRASVLRVRPVQ